MGDVGRFLGGGKWIKKVDVSGPIRLAITSTEAATNPDGKPQLVIHLSDGRCLGLNPTNTATLADAFGRDDAEWIGKEIEIYVDPSVKYGMRTIGGLRVRVPIASGPSEAPAKVRGRRPAPGVEGSADPIPF